MQRAATEWAGAWWVGGGARRAVGVREAGRRGVRRAARGRRRMKGPYLVLVIE